MTIRRSLLVSLAVVVAAVVAVPIVVHLRHAQREREFDESLLATTQRMASLPLIPGERKFCADDVPTLECIDSATKLAGHTIAWLPALDGFRHQRIGVAPYPKQRKPAFVEQIFIGPEFATAELASPALTAGSPGVKGQHVQNGTLTGTLYVMRGPGIIFLSIVWSTHGMTFTLSITGGPNETPDEIVRAWHAIRYSNP